MTEAILGGMHRASRGKVEGPATAATAMAMPTVGQEATANTLQEVDKGTVTSAVCLDTHSCDVLTSTIQSMLSRRNKLSKRSDAE